MKFPFTILISVIILSPAKAQIDSLFSKVNLAQQYRLENAFGENRDSVIMEFDKTMNAFFESEAKCRQLPDTSYIYFLVNKLSEITEGRTLAYDFINNIVITSNLKIRIYSWDNLDNGSYHTYTNYLQHKNKIGDCITIPLDTSAESPEVGYYKIESIHQNHKEYYLIFGYGTYGSGKQHFVIRVFEYLNGNVKESHSSYPEGKIIQIESNRSQNIELTYDKSNQTISYKEFKFDEEDGFYTNDFTKINLKLENGKLVKK